MEKVDVDQEVIDDELDCEGFLADGNVWSQDVAEVLAKVNEIGEYKLSEEHWNVIYFVRDFYRKYGTGPAIVKVVKHTGLSLKDLCRLFPCGLVKGAYKLAGLPKPPGCT